MLLKQLKEQFKLDLHDYAQNRGWYWYVLPWLFGLYIFIQLLSFDLNKPLPFVISIAQSANFILHELAHVFTTFLPAIITAVSGSFTELLLGLGLVVGAFLTRCYFAVLFCSLWFMLACQSVAQYMADARAQKLALVSLGNGFSGSEGVIHDWHFIFGELGILQVDTFIAGVVRIFGVLVGLFGLSFTIWIMYKMYSVKAIPEAASKPADRPTPKSPVTASRSVNLYPTVSKGPLALHEAPKEDPKK